MPGEGGPSVHPDHGNSANNGANDMTDNTCNGWRNAATWTVGLWFNDGWAAMAEDGIHITPEVCRADVEEMVYDLIGKDSTTAGFIWDMLDLNAVDWNELAAHHQTEEEEA